MRLQHSCSAFVIAIAGKVHAMMGAANSRSDSVDMPTLVVSFTANQSLYYKQFRRNRSGKVAALRQAIAQVVSLVDLAGNSVVATWVFPAVPQLLLSQ